MLQPGTSLARGYHVEKILGKGGMGAVYLARQPSLGRLVAIKETRLQFDDPEARAHVVESFRREAEILAELDHPHLVDVKDYFEEDGAHFLVMSYIDGATLSEVVAKADGPLAVGQVLAWADQMCDVLEYLHGRTPPVLVRDLKPGNVMVDARGQVKLIDFGIARVQHDGQHTVTFLKGAGTMGFAPVEQFGSSSTDARTDVYALGATLWYLLTAKVPPWSMHLASGETTLPAPSQLNPDVPEALDAVVLKAMALRRDERYQTVTSMRAALRAAAQPVPPPAPLPAPPPPPALPAAPFSAPPPSLPPLASQPRSSPFATWRSLVGVAVGVAVAIGMAWLLLGRGQSASQGVPSPIAISATPSAGAPVRMGVEMRKPGPFERGRLRIPGGGGVVVVAVVPGSPAARAQLAPRDVILSVDGTPVSAPQDVQRLVQRHAAGDAVTLEVWSRGAPRTVRVAPE